MIRAEMAFLRNNTIWYEFYSKLPPLGISKKIQVFSKNRSIFFQKDPNFERFEESYYFRRILRQICYNLAQK